MEFQGVVHEENCISFVAVVAFSNTGLRAVLDPESKADENPVLCMEGIRMELSVPARPLLSFRSYEGGLLNDWQENYELPL